MSAADLAEGYVAAQDVNGLADDYLLSPAPRARAKRRPAADFDGKTTL